jgi:polysaccharide export outer membrane protein
MLGFHSYRKTKSHNLLAGLLIYMVSLQLCSCNVTKNSTVFNSITRDTVLTFLKAPEINEVIQINDELEIAISSLNPEMDEKFNKSGFATHQSGNPNVYKIDAEGRIKFHHIGQLSVAGLALRQFSSMLEKQLEPYYKDLLVNVKFANKNITVLGLVNNPKTVQVQKGSLTIFDVLAQCGDLKTDADFRNILVFRDSAGVKQVGAINLEDNSVFNSKWFYLFPNDVVVVRKDEAKNLKNEKKRELQSNLSLVVSLVSLGAIILNIIIK